MSAVLVHVSHANKNMDMTRERICLILELMTMLLSFQMICSLVTALWPGLSWRVLRALGKTAEMALSARTALLLFVQQQQGSDLVWEM